MSSPLHIAYVSHLDPQDPNAWSGTVASMPRSLEAAGAKGTSIGPLTTPWSLLSGMRKIVAEARGETYLRDREPKVLHAWARQAAATLASLDADCVLSPSTLPVAHLETSLPRAIWIDATFEAMHAEYPPFSRLSAASIRAGNNADALALARTDAAIFSSDWARDTAVEAYGIESDQTHVVPFGANILAPSATDVERVIAARRDDHLELVFIAARWQGKGGDVALETARLLNAAGVATTLTIVGVAPQLDGPAPEWLRVTGFIDKRTSEGMAMFVRAVAKAHLLVFPTEFDAYGLAIAEANACGVPAIAPRIGGVSTVIADGKNGVLLEQDADANAYRDAAIRVWSDHEAYRSLALTAHNEFRERLNWGVAGDRVLSILENIAR